MFTTEWDVVGCHLIMFFEGNIHMKHKVYIAAEQVERFLHFLSNTNCKHLKIKVIILH